MQNKEKKYNAYLLGYQSKKKQRNKEEKKKLKNQSKKHKKKVGSFTLKDMLSLFEP